MKQFFKPRTVAVIGASPDKKSVGYSVLKNCFKSKVKTYPINPNHKKILGKKSHPSITNIKTKIDLAIITTPARTVPTILQQCADKKVKHAIIISSGFNETGNQELTNEIKKIIKEQGIRVIGPNCLGIITPENNFSFYNNTIKKGEIIMISQSGALGTGLLDYLTNKNIGLKAFISVGNMIDVTFSELLKHFSKTKTFMIYAEEIKKGREFLKACKNKKVIILKGGVTKQGSQATKTHTGSLATDERIIKGVFKQHGIIKVNSIEQLVKTTLTITRQKNNKNNKGIIISNAGGLIVLTIDALTKKNIKIIESKDLLGDATPEKFKEEFNKLLETRKKYDFTTLLLTPQSMTNIEKICRTYIEFAKQTPNKNHYAIILGGKTVEKGVELLEENKITVFKDPQKLAETLNLIQP